MRKRIIISFLVLSFFVFLSSSCGIPNAFYLDDSELYFITTGNNISSRLVFESDSGVFTGKLMFFYFVTNVDENINNIKTNLRTLLSNKYIFSYNAKPVSEVKDNDKKVVSYPLDGQSFGLFQLHINTTETENNFGNNGSNWADDYMFTCAEGGYRIEYEINSNNNLIISLYSSSGEELLGKASTYRCNDKSFNFDELGTDYILKDGVSSATYLYILPAIIVRSSDYSNQQLCISNGYISIQLNR